mgnify:CR=1 FL=1
MKKKSKKSSSKSSLKYTDNPINNLDLDLSKGIYDIFNGAKASLIPNYLGLIPYEIYVLPGMYLAILQVLWLGTPNPIQFHLLPHWFSYSVFQFLKGGIKRPRPGCHQKSMNKYIDEGHCSHGHEWQSFPSGHTGVSVALATSLFMEMMFSEHPHFFEISIESKTKRIIIASLGLFVALMVGLHRVSKGYHSFFDTCMGATIGFTIGFISWIALEYFKKLYNRLCEEKEQNNQKDDKGYCANYNYNKSGRGEFSYWLEHFNLFGYEFADDKFINITVGIARIILSVPILFLLYKFFSKDVFQLASIKH